MEIISAFLVAFIFIFLSELGDKTQLLILSFSTKTKVIPVFIGLALGSLFSHGVAIMLGSYFGNIVILQYFAYLSFILIGIYILIFKKFFNTTENINPQKTASNFAIGTIFIIAITIAISEIGDKTFMASLGLGINYPNSQIPLIIGSVLGMLASNLIAIVLGKFIAHKINANLVEKISGGLFLIFGILGLILL